MDIAAADAAKRDMARLLAPHDPRILNGVGPFATLIDASFPGYRYPVIVFKTEEPGSKQKLAVAHGAYRSLCFDLVNHLVNDIVVMGAVPVAVQDAIICGSLQRGVVTTMVAGLAEACRAQECSLTGGETSEQPGVLEPGTYVLAASVVGVVERAAVIDGSRIGAGDTVLALASNGVHTNGYSLVRRLLEDDPALAGRRLGEEFGARRTAAPAPLLPAGAAPVPGQREPARPRARHRRRYRGQSQPRAARRHGGRDRPVAHRGAGDIRRAARRRSRCPTPRCCACSTSAPACSRWSPPVAKAKCGRPPPPRAWHVTRWAGSWRRTRRRPTAWRCAAPCAGGQPDDRAPGVRRRPTRARSGASPTLSWYRRSLADHFPKGPNAPAETRPRRRLANHMPRRPNARGHDAAPPSPPKTDGSGLLQRIAAVVAAIPPGRVATYGQVAAQAGNRRAARQVAWALRVYSDRGLPWHRVLGAGGVIRLPEGSGLERQRALLLAEGVAVDAGGRLDLAAHQWRP